MLKIVRPICCGVDVHKSFIVATSKLGIDTSILNLNPTNI